MSSLDEAELLEAQALIHKAAPGIYTARKLYGPLWIMKVPTEFGPRFMASVEARHLTGIRFRDKTSSNHNRYDVLPR